VARGAESTIPVTAVMLAAPKRQATLIPNSIYNCPIMNASAKHEAQRILDRLPADASLEQIQYHLYVVQKIEAGLKDADEGRLITQEELERWIAFPNVAA